MQEHSSSVDKRAPQQASPKRRFRHLWLPAVLVVAAAAGVWAVGQSGFDRDVKLPMRTGVIGLALVALGLWFLSCAPFSRTVRNLVVFSPFVLLIAFFASFKPKHDGDVKFYWWDLASYRFRWGTDPDERLAMPNATNVAEGWEQGPHDYPRFLGADGRAAVTSVALVTDWQQRPPEEVWRKPIGAGWSGFAVVGDYAVTQEQRGDEELVVCYRIADGSIVWSHSDRTRFDPGSFTGQLGDIGPRATPTIHEAKVITHGATGIVNCLDARTGKAIWSHDTLREFGTGNVNWGKSNSPLVVDDTVVISVGAPGGKSLVAYDLESGDVRWSAGNYRSSYASPVLATIAGVRQIVSVDEDHVTAVRAEDGEALWEVEWPGNSDSNASVSQPMPVAGDRVFLSKGYGIGAELIHIHRVDEGDKSEAGGRLVAERLWKRPVMKTKMSNVVIHEGHVYGLDGGILQCIELETGSERWKARRGRYGHGQMLLVGDVILIMTEMDGELVLVRATPKRHEELGRYRVFAKGHKTWNNPALAGAYLLVRNDEEAVCLRLPLAADLQSAL
jgi:outer membrane protein assembly factor BamB